MITRAATSLGLRWRRLREFAARISPRARDVVAILISVGAAIAYAGSQYHRHSGLWLAAVAVSSLVATVALWWRRSRPVTVTLVALVAAAVSALPVALVIAVLTLTIRRRDRVLALIAALVYVADVVHTVGTGTGVVAAVVTTALFWAAVLAIGAYVGARRDLLVSLRQRAETAEAERELRADQARLGERTRIAREMHDVLAHKVSLIALHAGGLEVNPDAGSEQVERTAALVRTTAREALDDLRRVLGVLRADASADGLDLAPQPGLPEIGRLVAASGAAGIDVDLRCSVVGEPPAVLGRTAHRVVQESLTNVHKHARSAATVVSLAGSAGAGLDVEICNRAPVAAASLLPGAGMGLVGLAERVALVGGDLVSGPTQDGGWCVHAHLPWSEGRAS